MYVVCSMEQTKTIIAPHWKKQSSYQHTVDSCVYPAQYEHVHVHRSLFFMQVVENREMQKTDQGTYRIVVSSDGILRWGLIHLQYDRLVGGMCLVPSLGQIINVFVRSVPSRVGGQMHRSVVNEAVTIFYAIVACVLFSSLCSCVPAQVIQGAGMLVPVRGCGIGCQPGAG